MEKPSKNLDKLMHQLIKDAGVEKPSSGFKNRVMESIAAQSIPQKSYEPLISKRAWVAIALVIVVGIVIMYLLPSENSVMENLGVSLKFDVDFDLPKFQISKTFTYAIGFLALFLIQIPFLKRYLLGKN
jgi:hypothetical protein